jgi:putative spermidine/putrescine transport system permease protein
MTKQTSLTPWFLSAPALIIFLVFLLVPLTMTFILSFNSFAFYEGIKPTIGFENYHEVLRDRYFYEIFLRTFLIALATTVGCVVIGVPQAYFLSRMSSSVRSWMILIVLGPLLVSVVVRTLGWEIILGNKGVLNEALMAMGIVSSPMLIMYSSTGVIIALVHVLIPFMILAVWASLQRQDPATVSAAESLGAGPVVAFMRVVLPQAMPGVLSGSLIVFSLSASAFATPAIIGGRRLKVVSTVIYDQFMNTLNWPFGAAVAMLLLGSVLTIMLLWNRLVERRYSGVFE